MADFEDLVATKLASKVENLVDERVEAALKGNLATGYLKQAQMADYLSITPKTFHDKIMPLSPPTVVIDGLVRYPVDEFNQ